MHEPDPNGLPVQMHETRTRASLAQKTGNRGTPIRRWTEVLQETESASMHIRGSHQLVPDPKRSVLM